MFKKYMLVPYVRPIEKNTDTKVQELDSLMSTIVGNQKINIGDKVRLYNQSLAKFQSYFDPSQVSSSSQVMTDLNTITSKIESLAQDKDEIIKNNKHEIEQLRESISNKDKADYVSLSTKISQIADTEPNISKKLNHWIKSEKKKDDVDLIKLKDEIKKLRKSIKNSKNDETIDPSFSAIKSPAYVTAQPQDIANPVVDAKRKKQETPSVSEAKKPKLNTPSTTPIIDKNKPKSVTFQAPARTSTRLVRPVDRLNYEKLGKGLWLSPNFF